jgi:hypothetical protein
MNPLVVICGAATAVSYILPWASAPGLGRVTPREALAPLIEPVTLDSLQAAPPMVLVYLASFALAALVGVLALFGLGIRLVTLIAGLIPFGLIAWLYFNAADTLAAYGLPPVTTDDVSALIDGIRQVAGVGFYAWIGGAAGLVLAFLFPQRR